MAVLIKRTAKEVFEDYHACYLPAEVFGGEEIERDIIFLMDTNLPFEEKVWLLSTEGFCSKTFFNLLAQKFADFSGFEFLLYGKSLKEKALNEQDEQKKKTLGHIIMTLAHKNLPQEGSIQFIKDEIMKALGDGSLYT